MKYLLSIAIAISFSHVNAQTNGGVTGAGGNSGTGRVTRSSVNGKSAKENAKTDTGVNTHSYMPGSSPVGTGGAGGDEMSGSRKGSALDNAVNEQPSNKVNEPQTSNAVISETDQQERTSGQAQGIKDATPGSPSGTGGAGGDEMSGSRKGSANNNSINRGTGNNSRNNASGQMNRNRNLKISSGHTKNSAKGKNTSAKKKS